MGRWLWVAGLLGAAVCPCGAMAEIVLENPRLRAVLGDDAVWKSLVDKTTGNDYCAASKPIRIADVRLDGQTHRAIAAGFSDGQLTVSFEDCDTQLVYAVATAADWIAFRIVEVRGSRPAELTLLALGVTITERGGSRLNAAWNDDYAVCLRAINLQTRGELSRRSDHTLLTARTQDAPGPKLEGAGAAIVVAPPDQLKPILVRFAEAFDLPRNEGEGVASRDLPMARQSYWFLDFGEKDVDCVIDYCRKAGFRQVMLGSASWCASVGHFTVNTRQFPDGIDSLRRTVARFHQDGILVGMHTFASKVSKSDGYVTPVPDRGFWVDLTATLAGDVGPSETSIRTTSDLSQWPGSPVCKQKVWEGHVSKHQEVIIDDEIIRFESIGPDGEWNTFLGCRRGSWGTQAAAHSAAAECRHYAVDGCINGYILDQESPLFQKTTSRLAEVFNDCDFDMVYFDGSEDVDLRRYDYYSSNAHATAMRKFKKRPLIHMGGGRTHGLWHSFTRAGTIDQYPGTYLAYIHAGGAIAKWPTCKDHIDTTVRRVTLSEENMMPAELGWFGIGPKSGNYDGLQFDEIEYLMCKSLAHNAPISLQTSFSRMEAHPLTPDILEIVRQYEEVRLARRASDSELKRLGQKGKDFVMLPAMLRGEREPAEFVAVDEVAAVAGGHDVRAWVGSHGSDALATVWHYAGKEGKLFLDVPAAAAYDVRGERVAVNRTDGKFVIGIGAGRLLLVFPGLATEAVRKALKEATIALRKPLVFWMQAEDYQQRVGSMKKGSEIGVEDPGALGDVVLCDGPIDRSGRKPSYCQYRIEVPSKGRWTLWARVRYPTGGDMSFGLVRPEEEVVLSGDQVLGNCGLNDKSWHWTGRGGGITTAPPGSPIVFDLEPGPFVFRIYPREGSGKAATTPRVDCFCLCDDADYMPTDIAAAAALGE